MMRTMTREVSQKWPVAFIQAATVKHKGMNVRGYLDGCPAVVKTRLLHETGRLLLWRGHDRLADSGPDGVGCGGEDGKKDAKAGEKMERRKVDDESTPRSSHTARPLEGKNGFFIRATVLVDILTMVCSWFFGSLVPCGLAHRLGRVHVPCWLDVVITIRLSPSCCQPRLCCPWRYRLSLNRRPGSAHPTPQQSRRWPQRS